VFFPPYLWSLWPQSGFVPDVVLDDHDVAHGVAAVEPPRCVRHDLGFHAQQEEDSSGYVTWRHKRSELHLLLLAYYFDVIRKMHQRKPII